jgi:acyl dehydratase
MIDPKFIGHQFATTRLDVEKGRIKAFADAIGATDPIHFDEAAARAQGYATVVAPPTFLTIAEMERSNDPQCQTLPDLLGLDLSRFLHGEQEYEYLAPVYAGDVLTVTCAIKDIYNKRNGALEFIVLEMEYHKSTGELAARSLGTAVYRAQ